MQKSSTQNRTHLLKLGIIATSAVLLYNYREQVMAYLSDWAADKLNFQILKVTNFAYDPFTNLISFRVNFSLNNFLQIPFTITHMVIKIYKATGTDEHGITQWQQIAERQDTERSIEITPGTNEQNIKVSTPLKASASAIGQTILDRMLYDNPQQFKLSIDATVQGQEQVPIHEETTFTI